MASGRMIARSLGRSNKYNQLPDHFTKLVYIHALTGADELGRIEADAIAIYGDYFVVDPEASLERIEVALGELHRVGLIQLYEAEGKRYAQFADFDKHNTVRRDKDGNPTREARSRIPDPPTDCAGPAQEPRRSRTETDPQVEVQDQDQVEVQEEHSSPNGDTLAPKSGGEIQQVIDAYNANRGNLPAAQKVNSNRRSKIKTLIRDLGGTEKAVAAMSIAAQEVAHDDFWRKRQYGLDNLLNGQKVLQKAETAWNRGSFDHQQSERDRMLAALGAN